MVLDVADVCHGITYFEVNLVRTVEYAVEDGLEFGIDICLFVTHLGEKIPVLLRFKGTFIPRLCRVCLAARCTGDEAEEKIE